MKQIVKFFRFSLILCFMLSVKMAFDLTGGIYYTPEEIAIKYTVSFIVGILMELSIKLTWYINLKLKAGTRNLNHEVSRLIMYTGITSVAGIGMCLFHVLVSSVWHAEPGELFTGTIRISIVILCLAAGIFCGPAGYLLEKLLKKLRKKEADPRISKG
ncbi:MAG: hypothetical protein LBG76_08580 [Treponema sp.]|nr:hypothetical protein [Treponema sp.]